MLSSTASRACSHLKLPAAEAAEEDDDVEVDFLPPPREPLPFVGLSRLSV